MTKKVMDAFAAHSITPEAMKIPLAQRQSTPCDFNAGRGRTSLDWVTLKGETIVASESSPPNGAGSSNSGVKPLESQKPMAPADSGSTIFQQIGALCDPSKAASGKTVDRTQLLCNTANDGKSYWQLK